MTRFLVLSRFEGRIWSAGLALIGFLVLEFLLIRVLWAEAFEALLVGLGAEIAAGREAGIPVAIAAGAPRVLVWQVSFTQDLAGAMFGFPIFLLLLERYHDRDNVLMRRVRRIEAAAERHRKAVHRWGPVGLGVFMLLPFLVNGPFIALILGRLAGMRRREVLWSVIAATILTAAAWTYFFDRMHALATRVDDRFGWVIAGVAVLVVVLLAVVDLIRDRRRPRPPTPDAIGSGSDTRATSFEEEEPRAGTTPTARGEREASTRDP